MITVGTFEAKTHLSNLLEQVINGEEILITKHGKPVARLIPEITANRIKIDEVIAQLKAVRQGVRLDGLSWKELRDEGRR
ncbi:MAG: type II toxin-antitoxin system Phd/YefM family antitoxin [Endozoicomonas sp.]